MTDKKIVKEDDINMFMPGRAANILQATKDADDQKNDALASVTSNALKHPPTPKKAVVNIIGKLKREGLKQCVIPIPPELLARFGDHINGAKLVGVGMLAEMMLTLLEKHNKQVLINCDTWLASLAESGKYDPAFLDLDPTKEIDSGDENLFKKKKSDSE
jgi:hypothetical protein